MGNIHNLGQGQPLSEFFHCRSIAESFNEGKERGEGEQGLIWQNFSCGRAEMASYFWGRWGVYPKDGEMRGGSAKM